MPLGREQARGLSGFRYFDQVFDLSAGFLVCIRADLGLAWLSSRSPFDARWCKIVQIRFITRYTGCRYDTKSCGKLISSSVRLRSAWVIVERRERKCICTLSYVFPAERDSLAGGVEDESLIFASPLRHLTSLEPFHHTEHSEA